jgi:hypothetical protein
LALVIAKNTVQNNWSRRETIHGSVGIEDDEKIAIKAAALNLIGQNSFQLAMQIALLIGKIARHDYPSHWYSRSCTPAYTQLITL